MYNNGLFLLRTVSKLHPISSGGKVAQPLAATWRQMRKNLLFCFNEDIKEELMMTCCWLSSNAQGDLMGIQFPVNSRDNSEQVSPFIGHPD
jgi:hypothetical protein